MIDFFLQNGDLDDLKRSHVDFMGEDYSKNSFPPTASVEAKL